MRPGIVSICSSFSAEFTRGFRNLAGHRRTPSATLIAPMSQNRNYARAVDDKNGMDVADRSEVSEPLDWNKYIREEVHAILADLAFHRLESERLKIELGDLRANCEHDYVERGRISDGHKNRWEYECKYCLHRVYAGSTPPKDGSRNGF